MSTPNVDMWKKINTRATVFFSTVPDEDDTVSIDIDRHLDCEHWCSATISAILQINSTNPRIFAGNPVRKSIVKTTRCCIVRWVAPLLGTPEWRHCLG